MFAILYYIVFMVSPMYLFATLNKEQNPQNLEKVYWENVGLRVCFSQKCIHCAAEKMRKKTQHVNQLRFPLNYNLHMYPKNCPLKIACSRP